MQITSRFTVAIHLLTYLDLYLGRERISSERLAGSIGVNPVIVRSVIGELRAAGIVTSQRGSGGANLARPLSEISFYDVYRAVESVDEKGLFHFHEQPNPACPVGRGIHAVLDGRLREVQEAMEARLKSITLSEVVTDMRARIEGESCA